MNLLQGCANRVLGPALAWLNEPARWNAGPDGVAVELDVVCDFFRPWSGQAKDGAHLVHTRLRGDFTVTASISANLANTFDAGGLVLRAGAELWAKLCIERGVKGETKVVSVVTRHWSDDADHVILPRAEAWLRVTRKGAVVALHYSEDGRLWRFVRVFPLELPDEVMVGALAQAPREPGGSVLVRTLTASTETVADFRSGE
jgi:uncharacterized protein